MCGRAIGRRPSHVGTTVSADRNPPAQTGRTAKSRIRPQRLERRRSVKGPIGATLLSLPFTEIMLTTTFPALLKSMLNAAVRRTNQRQAAGKPTDSSSFSGARAHLRWPDVWKTAKEGDSRSRNRRRSETQPSTQSGRSAS